MTTSTASTLADYAAELRFLTEHPDLPIPRGFDLSEIGLSLFVHTAAQVRAWADAIAAEVGETEYQGNTHYSAHTFDPFYVTVTAIVSPDDEVTR